MYVYACFIWFLHKYCINLQAIATTDIIMNNEIKTQLQQREFSSLKDQRRVILKWATGCGKSKMAITLANHVRVAHRAGKPCSILFVVGERAHFVNWYEEILKWATQWTFDDNLKWRMICYHSLHKVENRHYDVIIFDEAHHMFTNKRLGHIQTLSGDYVYLLSATLSSSKVTTIEEIFGKFTTSTISLKDAIQQDILPDPKVYVVAMELDDTRVNQTIAARKGDNPMVVSWENRNKYKFKSVPYTIQCTQKQKNIWFTNEMEYWKQRYENSHNAYHHNFWVNLGSQRKRFLGELKTQAVRSLLGMMPNNKRFVCFCASVAQAENLCAKDTISSKKTSKHNQKIIDDFNARKTNSIYAVGMITEGMNLNGIEVGIITQLDGKERLFIQKFGRSLRAEDPVAFIFYFKDTQDEVYLKNALDNIDSKYVQHININQINSIKL